MKAFVVAVILLVAISAVAAVSLNSLPTSAKDTFTVKQNVRL